MKRILIPTDFSNNATNALKYAIFLAKKASCKLLVIHDTRSSNHSDVSGKSYDRIVKDAKDKLQKIKDEIKKNSDTKDIECDTRLIQASLHTFVYNIKEAVSKDDIDLVVMGTNGASGINKILIGSNTVDVIKKVGCPVFAIPGNSKFQPIKRIMFASDYEKVDISALKLIKKIAVILDSEIDFISINKYVRETISVKKKEEIKRLDRFFGKDVKHTFEFYVDDDVLKGINEYLKYHQDVGMIIMVTRRKDTLYNRIFNPSFTKKMAFHTNFPLLAVHS